MASGRTVKRVRTCIACGAREDKRGLLRVVRTPDGRVTLDAGGRAAGRGAYVCSRACFDDAARAKRLSRALKAKVTDEDYARIASELDALCGPVEG